MKRFLYPRGAPRPHLVLLRHDHPSLPFLVEPREPDGPWEGDYIMEDGGYLGTRAAGLDFKGGIYPW